MQRQEMYLQELEERAQLLRRLQYDRAYVRMRLIANVAWDFDARWDRQLIDRKHLTDAVDAIVERVFTRGSSPRGRRDT